MTTPPDSPYWWAVKKIFFVAKRKAYGYVKGDIIHSVLVKDGDTYRARVDMGDSHDPETDLRVEGLDTPEKYGTTGTCRGCRKKHTTAEKEREKKACALVRTYVIDLIGKAVPTKNYPEGLAALSHEKAKYKDRVVAELFVHEGDDAWFSITQNLLQKGYAKEYDGGTKGCFNEWWKHEV